MTIYKFQNGTKDYAVGVLYSTHGEEFRLQSDDQPRSELFLHAASVAYLAIELFGLEGLRAGLREIAFSDGQNGPATSVTLSVPTNVDIDAKMALPKVTRRDLEDAQTHEVDPAHPRNAYNLAVTMLWESIVEYVQGRRQQAMFDFQEEQKRVQGDSVIQFRQAEAVKA